MPPTLTSGIRPFFVFLSLALAAIPFAALAQNVESEVFGRLPEAEGGAEVHLYTLTNAHGLRARVMDWGATLVSVETPDREGKLDTITPRLETFDDYLAGHPLFGSVVGRYANRIDGGGFTIGEKRYDLKTVNAKTGVHIHGGKTGLQRQHWKGKAETGEGFVAVRLIHESPDGHEGFPGNLKISVTYRLTEDNALWLEYRARSDRATHVNLTNHAYWNLAGLSSGRDVLDHQLTLNAHQVLDADERKIPTGKLLPVKGTPFDFLKPHPIGSRLAEVEGGYDHCYVVDHGEGALEMAARVEDPQSGRFMEVWTTEPGVQLYTANGLNGKLQFQGRAFGPQSALCLECQHFPNSPNVPSFPSTLLRPGETYRQTTVHKFGVMAPASE